MISTQEHGQGKRRRRVWRIGLGRQPERMWPTKRAALNIINLELFPRKIDNDGLNRNKESSNSSSSSIWGGTRGGEKVIEHSSIGSCSKRAASCVALLSTRLQSATCPPPKCYGVFVSHQARLVIAAVRFDSVCVYLCLLCVCLLCVCASNRNADPWVDAANCKIILKLSSWMVICLMAALIGHCQKFSSGIGWYRHARGGGGDWGLTAL